MSVSKFSFLFTLLTLILSAFPGYEQICNWLPSVREVTGEWVTPVTWGALVIGGTSVFIFGTLAFSECIAGQKYSNINCQDAVMELCAFELVTVATAVTFYLNSNSEDAIYKRRIWTIVLTAITWFLTLVYFKASS